MVNSFPFIEDILKDTVNQANTFFSTQPTDPFNVFFDHGLYVDVSKSVYKKTNDGIKTYPLVWLLTTSIDITTSNKLGGSFGEAKFDIIIAMPTDKDQTPEQRKENVFKPRLAPIYSQIIEGLGGMITNRVHDIGMRPYWGGGEGGTDTKNLFGNYIDALYVRGIRVNLKKQKCTTFKLK